MDHSEGDRRPRSEFGGAMGDGRPNVAETEFVEGQHFYYEGPFVVLTALAHLQRGHCCGNGCRHCPYGGKD